MSRRVILTYGRSLQTLAAAKSLSEQGLSVVCCDDAPLMAAQFSRHVDRTFTHAAPDREPDRFIDQIETELRRYQDDDPPPMLMPMHRETRLIAQHRDRLSKVACIAVPESEMIDRVWPKDHLIETARDAGIPHPETIILDEDGEADPAAQTYPLFVKAAGTYGAYGVRKVDRADGLLAAIERVSRWAEANNGGPVLLQQSVDGKDYCFTGLWRHGELVAHMTYRNIQMLPPSGGTGVLRETVEATALVEPARRLMKHANWHGVAQVDFRWTGDTADAPKLIEVNPRFWAGLYQSIASGIDFPVLLYRMTEGEPIDEIPEAKVGTRTTMPLAGLYGAIRTSLDDESFDRLSEAWQEMANTDRREMIWPALKAVGKAMIDVVNPVTRVDRLAEALDQHLSAELEAVDKEDPLVPLGLLYVIGSVVRNGRLPSELQ